jgi:hypothetical protein
MNNVLRSLAALVLVSACAVAPALAASKPKRGTYIDPKLSTYIVTTKDVTAIKSFQTACIVSGQQSGSLIVSRKLKIKSNGSFSYTGNAKIYSGNPKPSIGKVTITARYSGGRYKGTASFPKGYACAVANFSAKYYGVNPKG